MKKSSQGIERRTGGRGTDNDSYSGLDDSMGVHQGPDNAELFLNISGIQLYEMPISDPAVSTGVAPGDVAHAGSGSDFVIGSNGNDVVFGEDGNDVVIGAGGNDVIMGGIGNDIIYGDLPDSWGATTPSTGSGQAQGTLFGSIANDSSYGIQFERRIAA